MSIEKLDVLIVGAGLSGIDAGVHLSKACPDQRFAILEARERMGGTWDLFRYPGIRSDSDMYTLGYAFKPWTNPKAIADGPDILAYIQEAAREHDIERHIRYQHRVKRAAWSSADACWQVDVERGPAHELTRIHCKFLFLCSGYYNYEHGYTPHFEGIEHFKGQVVHPQNWPEHFDYSGKRVVVIGSGATAVTLVPAMTDKAAHVTMLQRSPTYVITLPGQDKTALWLNQKLPLPVAYWLTRWKMVLRGMLFYRLSKRRPEMMKNLIIKGVQMALGPNFDVAKHFTPSYKPWDQRVCAVPDGDMFRVIKQGKASVVTDHIDTITETGIKLKSGEELKADIIITATGLDLLAMGGIEVSVDGKPLVLKQAFSYKGMMLEGVPNFAYVVGYTNASWTLKADLTCQYVCRLLNHMTKTGLKQCMPVMKDKSVEAENWIDFNSGYILRSIDQFPKQGSKAPWRLHQNYALDILTLRWGSIDDGTMMFSNPAPNARSAPTAVERAA